MSDLTGRLCSEAQDFNFFRAVMLLEEYFQKTAGIANPIDAGKIRFLPDESIAFPPNDILAIRENDSTISFILSFMGLVGVTSPLPVYFSEYLSAHPETSRALYDFLAIFNHRMYALFYRAWKKYHFLFNFKADGSDTFTRKIAMLTGIDTQREPQKMRLLAYCGIMSSATRSAAGLQTLIADYFGGIPVAINEFPPVGAAPKCKADRQRNAPWRRNDPRDYLFRPCRKIQGDRRTAHPCGVRTIPSRHR